MDNGTLPVENAVPVEETLAEVLLEVTDELEKNPLEAGDVPVEKAVPEVDPSEVLFRYGAEVDVTPVESGTLPVEKPVPDEKAVP